MDISSRPDITDAQREQVRAALRDGGVAETDIAAFDDDHGSGTHPLKCLYYGGYTTTSAVKAARGADLERCQLLPALVGIILSSVQLVAVTAAAAGPAGTWHGSTAAAQQLQLMEQPSPHVVIHSMYELHNLRKGARSTLLFLMSSNMVSGYVIRSSPTLVYCMCVVLKDRAENLVRFLDAIRSLAPIEACVNPELTEPYTVVAVHAAECKSEYQRKWVFSPIKVNKLDVDIKKLYTDPTEISEDPAEAASISQLSAANSQMSASQNVETPLLLFERLKTMLSAHAPNSGH